MCRSQAPTQPKEDRRNEDNLQIMLRAVSKTYCSGRLPDSMHSLPFLCIEQEETHTHTHTFRCVCFIYIFKKKQLKESPKLRKRWYNETYLNLPCFTALTWDQVNKSEKKIKESQNVFKIAQVNLQDSYSTI